MFYKTMAWSMGLTALNSQYWQWFAMPKYFIYRLQRFTVLTIGPLSTISQVIYLILFHSVHTFQSLSMIFAIILASFIVMVNKYQILLNLHSINNKIIA